MTQALDQSIIEPDRTFGFHAQQAVEKLLKALIGGHGERYAFTHNVETLVDHAVALGEQIPVRTDLIVALTDFAGVWRYHRQTAYCSAIGRRLECSLATPLLASIAKVDAESPGTFGRLRNLVEAAGCVRGWLAC